MHANDAAEEDAITRTLTRRLAQELAERDDNTGNLTGMIAEGDAITKNLTREDNIAETLTGEHARDRDEHGPGNLIGNLEAKKKQPSKFNEFEAESPPRANL